MRARGADVARRVRAGAGHRGGCVVGPGVGRASCRCRALRVASVPPKVSVTGRLYQPASLGCRSGVRCLSPGAVASYLSGKARSAALPAWSVQRPTIDAVALSGRVGDGRAAVDARGRVGAGERVRDGPVVPITGVRASVRRTGRDLRRGRVVLQAERERCARVAGVVGACPADRAVALSGPAVGRARARLHARDRIGAGEGDVDRLVVPAVRVGVTRRVTAGDGRPGRVVLEGSA